MSRSGYSDEGNSDNWALIRWHGAVNSAINGKRGQAFLREALAALDALPEKKLISGELESQGQVCLLGAVGKSRGMQMDRIDPEDHETIANCFRIPNALACELMWFNDDAVGYWREETPEQRFTRMRQVIQDMIVEGDSAGG
jgi:hypothetical protein